MCSLLPAFLYREIRQLSGCRLALAFAKLYISSRQVQNESFTEGFQTLRDRAWHVRHENVDLAFRDSQALDNFFFSLDLLEPACSIIQHRQSTLQGVDRVAAQPMFENKVFLGIFG